MKNNQLEQLVRLVLRLSRSQRGTKKTWTWLLIAAIVGYALLAGELERRFGLPNILGTSGASRSTSDAPPRTTGNSGTSGSDVGEQEILDAFAEQRSDVIVQSHAEVFKNLPDDLQGDRHQKFLLRLSSGHTLLLAHNIDLAPRVPARVGDQLEFSGEYEYSAQGGVIHWTHHDPGGRHHDGWIRYDGQTYR